MEAKRTQRTARPGRKASAVASPNPSQAPLTNWPSSGPWTLRCSVSSRCAMTTKSTAADLSRRSGAGRDLRREPTCSFTELRRHARFRSAPRRSAEAVMLIGRRALRRLALKAATYRFLGHSKGNGRTSCGQLHLRDRGGHRRRGRGRRGTSRRRHRHLRRSAARRRQARTPGYLRRGGLRRIGSASSPPAKRDPGRALGRFGIGHAKYGALLAGRSGPRPLRLRRSSPGTTAAPPASAPRTLTSPACSWPSNVAGMLSGIEADHASSRLRSTG